MTDATVGVGPEPSLPSDPPAGIRAGAGLEGRPALVSLVASGGAPVCEGDVCVVPGAE